MTEAEGIARIAAVMRSVYCAERNRWHQQHQKRVTTWGSAAITKYDGGTDAAGRVFANVWERLARFVVHHQLDPARFVRAQFAGYRPKPPDPPQLMTAEAVAAYRVARVETPEGVRAAFDFQKQQTEAEVRKLGPARARTGWSAADALRAVLGSGMVALSALFRHCLAARHGLPDVAAMFRDEALDQYLSQPDDYDGVWGDWITPDLRAAAAALRAYAAAPQQQAARLAGPAAGATTYREIARD